ncbi:MAG: hypothetical protein IJS14_02745 [Lentisphaeria bacterium]|nr:hypothetical protein [Lentisphaeria bacterium]
MNTEKFCAEADFGRAAGHFNRNQHGSNTAPNLSNRGVRDFTPDYKRMKFAWSRNHDWALWNHGQRVVDTHFVFPLMHLDPADPANYYFDATDEMIRITQEAGSKVFYRLGTSIEHSGLRPDQKHFNSLPPKDYAKYAEALAGIVRHYTRGWANGFHYDMPYWEIWNEAENDPTCWRGTYEEFIKFFVVVLKRLKAEFPEHKIGGPAATGFREDLIRPLLKACREAGVAPDFISWHSYCCDPDRLIGRPVMMRKLLDEEGLPDCETAVTEWHYLVSWEGVQNNMDPEKRRQAAEGPASLVGIDSAAYNLAVLSGWQDTPLDLGFYYGANPNGGWGFYTTYGAYNRNFHSMCMFGEFLEACPDRIRTQRLADTVYLLGGLSADGKTGRLLVSDYRGDSPALSIRVAGMDGASVSAELLDQEHDRTPAEFDFRDGVLTLRKNTPGSAAFMVTFQKNG